MTVSLTIKCHNCMHDNRQYLGMPNYELKESEFGSFSEAVKHATNNPEHWMDWEIRVEEDESRR